MTRWQFNRTFMGDPNTHTPSEAIGHRDHHVELAEFIDSRGNTKIEPVEEHPNPGVVSGPWELIDTYYGDPETGAHHETTGRKPYHRRLGRYINPHGKVKTEILNEDEYEQSWQEQKREYHRKAAQKRRDRQREQQASHPPSAAGNCENTVSLAAMESLTYETLDGRTKTVHFDNSPENND